MTDEPPHESAAPTPERAPPVDDLVVELLERTEAASEGRAEVVDELCRRWPSRADRLRSAVSNLERAGLVDVDEIPDAIGELRPLRRLGGGGMGVVLLAHQPSLGRRVALKLLRTDELLRAGARDRFRREVEAVARLSHPNVVAVHSLGSEGGVPYLVMDHVEGASLDRVLAAQAGSDPSRLTGADFRAAILADMAGRGESAGGPAPAWFDGAWTDVCLRVAREVARALAHAHARGVLHRDVKPSNVMVTPDGRVQLVDFGLASIVDAERLTRSGAQLGSLPYMPPESLEGSAAPDARGDVYSLGVTLFELVLLALPFPGRGTSRLRDDILEGRFVVARSENAAIGTDLETVLRCACDRDPRRRYASAEAFAADLTALLEGGAVAARPASAAARALRWVRRRPEQAGLSAAVAVLLVGGPLAFGVVQHRHATQLGALNGRLGEALESESAALRRSEENVRRATEAIVGVTGHMAWRGLEHEPRMQRARLDVAEDAIRLLGEVLADRPDDPRLLYPYARLHLVRGGILHELGRPADGLPDVRVHDALLARFLSGELDASEIDADARLDRASGRFEEALILRELGRHDEALPIFAETTAELRTLTEHEPGSCQRVEGYVHAADAWAHALRAADRVEQAEEVLAEAHPVARDHAAARPDRARAFGGLGQIERTRCILSLDAGDHDAAAAAGEAGADALARALEVAPGHRTYQALFVETTQRAAEALTRLGRLDDAAAALDRSRPAARDLVARYPSIREYRQRELEVVGLASFLAAERGRCEEAAELATATLEGLRALHGEGPLDAPEALEIASAEANLAGRVVTCAELGPARLDRAERLARSALAVVTEAHPEAPRAASVERLARYNLVLVLAAGDRAEEARGETLALAAVTPARPVELRLLADAWCEVLGVLLRTGGEDGLAAEARAAALDELERAIDAGYANRAELEATPALDPLRGEGRFAALLARLPGH